MSENPADTHRYKYLLDLGRPNKSALEIRLALNFTPVDGNGWSARFKRLMSTNSVVLKSTIFPEWYQDRIQPCEWIRATAIATSVGVGLVSVPILLSVSVGLNECLG